jgi:hypothetical protein
LELQTPGQPVTRLVPFDYPGSDHEAALPAKFGGQAKNGFTRKALVLVICVNQEEPDPWLPVGPAL